jgi:hypothetical protein
MNRLARSAALAVAFSLCAPAVARADGTLSPAAKAAAQKRYAKGLELYATALRTHDQATIEEAYLQFVQAYSVYPDDKVLWNLAVSANDTHRFVEALHDFRAFNAHTHAAENEKHPQHALIVDYLDQLMKKTAHVDVDAPPGARIELDGAPAGTAPLGAPIDMLPGAHDLSANVTGTVTHESVYAEGGGHTAVRLGSATDQKESAKRPELREHRDARRRIFENRTQRIRLGAEEGIEVIHHVSFHS